MNRTIEAFGQQDGWLTVGGIRADRLAERAGQTPFFAYDRQLISHRVQYLRRHIPADVELNYAIKANPMPAVVQHVSTLVDGLDVASAGEMRLALDTGTPPGRIGFAGPGKSTREVGQAVAAGVTIEMESATELQRVTAAGERLGIRPRVAVRVNPDFAVRGSGMRMGGGPQQFGIDAEAVPELMKSLLARDLDFQGFHIFAGSQNLNAEILAEAQQRIVDLVIRLSAAAGIQPRYLNIGGGFGIPYSSKDAHLDVPLLGNRLQSLVQDVVRPALGAVRIAIELGRYVVGEAGVYLTRVVDRKVSRGVPFIVVDGGLHHQLAASGNFGQAIRRNYPVANAGRMNEDDSEMQNVVGCLCTPLDVLAEKVMLPPAQVGDLVAVFMAGAYGFTASPTAFLGHPPPLELLV